MEEYKKQLKKGYIQKAYRGLMHYFNGLRLFFKKNYPEDSVSSIVYYGYMDMTYFAFFTSFLKTRKLKIAIVFLHEQFRFEVWLCGFNKKVQTKYWNLFKNRNWKKYPLSSTLKGVDSIMEHVLVETPDFTDLDKLTTQIEHKTIVFVNDVKDFLSEDN
jgi:hypothetical protein